MKSMSQAQVACSAAAVPYSRIRELAEIAMGKAARGETIYRLYFGESNLPTPPFIKQAAARHRGDGVRRAGAERDDPVYARSRG